MLNPTRTHFGHFASFFAKFSAGSLNDPSFVLLREEYLKTSETRLYFVADRIFEITLEMYKDPRKVVQDGAAEVPGWKILQLYPFFRGVFIYANHCDDILAYIVNIVTFDSRLCREYIICVYNTIKAKGSLARQLLRYGQVHSWSHGHAIIMVVLFVYSKSCTLGCLMLLVLARSCRGFAPSESCVWTCERSSSGSEKRGYGEVLTAKIRRSSPLFQEAQRQIANLSCHAVDFSRCSQHGFHFAWEAQHLDVGSS